MTLIRQVLVDRQLSHDQAQLLIRQKELRDIFEEADLSEEESWSDFDQAVPVEDKKSSEQRLPTAA
jgi:hypothetical protein